MNKKRASALLMWKLNFRLYLVLRYQRSGIIKPESNIAGILYLTVSHRVGSISLGPFQALAL